MESQESIDDLPEDFASAWAAVVINIWEKKEQSQAYDVSNSCSKSTKVEFPEVFQPETVNTSEVPDGK